jgi:hypothetical protein
VSIVKQIIAVAALFIYILFLVNGMASGQSHPNIPEVTQVLYDASKGSNPDKQGWTYLSNFFGQSQAERFTENSVHRFNTMQNIAEMAGYFGTNHPGIGTLDRQGGFSIRIHLRMLDDVNTSENRAGFSVIALSDDLLGVEVVFRMDTIWVYTENFDIAELSGFDTATGFREYGISVHNNNYEVTAGNEPVLSGLLRDYSGFGTPYNISNFVFFGDNTSRSGADVEITRITLHKNAEIHPPEIPELTTLHQNFPNPFQNSTNIIFELDEPNDVKLEVYDITGRKVTSLASANYPAGVHRVPFEAHRLSPGLYICRLTTGRHVLSKKMVLVR